MDFPLMNDNKARRKQSQIRAEQNHETHRIHHKIVANFATNPEFAEKLKRYKESGKLTPLLHEALKNAPPNPDDYIVKP